LEIEEIDFDLSGRQDTANPDSPGGGFSPGGRAKRRGSYVVKADGTEDTETVAFDWGFEMDADEEEDEPVAVAAAPKAK
jgi:hypothetical protein